MTKQEQVLRHIAEIVDGISVAYIHLGDAINKARQLEATWEDIGQALGITKQAAWEQYHHIIR